MDSNLEKILKEFELLKGQFVIISYSEIERLVARGDDGEDYYYITFNGRDFRWSTCVGRVMPLKGYLRDMDYNELVRLAELNHYDKMDFEAFTRAFVDWKNSLSSTKSFFHTEFCFRLERSNPKT
jgi:hypothetical protein